jgi:hypothetical protein
MPKDEGNNPAGSGAKLEIKKKKDMNKKVDSNSTNSIEG